MKSRRSREKLPRESREHRKSRKSEIVRKKVGRGGFGERLKRRRFCRRKVEVRRRSLGG